MIDNNRAFRGMVRGAIVVLLSCMLCISLSGCNSSCDGSGELCARHSECCSDNCQDGTCCYAVGQTCEGDRECCEGLQCVGSESTPLTCCVPGGSSAGSAGVTCSEDDDCCSGHCVDGRCCFGPGQRGVCEDDGDCCDGLECLESTGRCEEPQCPSGCHWVVGAATHGEGGHCECPGSGDGGDGGGGVVDPELPECVPCTVCPTAPEDEQYIMRVHNDEEGFCCVAGSPPFWAPDDATAAECARLICGCADCPTCFHCDVENVTHTPDPYLSCPMP